MPFERPTEPGARPAPGPSRAADRSRSPAPAPHPDPLDGSKQLPLFRYYTYDLTKSPPTPTKELVPGSGGLNVTDVSSIAKITVSYRVRAVGKVTQRVSTPLVGEIFVRTVDPNTASPKPTCL